MPAELPRKRRAWSQQGGNVNNHWNVYWFAMNDGDDSDKYNI